MWVPLNTNNSKLLFVLEPVLWIRLLWVLSRPDLIYFSSETLCLKPPQIFLMQKTRAHSGSNCWLTTSTSLCLPRHAHSLGQSLRDNGHVPAGASVGRSWPTLTPSHGGFCGASALIFVLFWFYYKVIMTKKRQGQPSIKPAVAACASVVPSPSPSTESSQWALRYDMLIPCRVALVKAGTAFQWPSPKIYTSNML